MTITARMRRRAYTKIINWMRVDLFVGLLFKYVGNLFMHWETQTTNTMLTKLSGNSIGFLRLIIRCKN